MYISAKALLDGEIRGKAYSYQAPDSMQVGDVVLAPFGKTEATLQVVEINLDPKQFEGLDYEIKSIVGLAEEVPETVIDIKITEETLPVISINYDEIKANLEIEMKKYQNIIVTEETLKSCKATQKELAGLKNKIDTYRKDKKKIFSAPIVAFEEKCKELISLVESVESPIKDGIAVFDDETKKEKRKAAHDIIDKVVAKVGLTEKYANQLTVIDKYMNLSETVKNTTADIEQRAMTLKIEQDREDELLDIIKATIESENKRINQKLDIADVQRLIDLGSTTTDILAEVKRQADRIYQAENPPVIEEVPVEEVEEVPFADIEPTPIDVPCTAVNPNEHKQEKIFILAKISGDKETMQGVVDLMRENDLVVEIIEDGFM